MPKIDERTLLFNHLSKKHLFRGTLFKVPLFFIFAVGVACATGERPNLELVLTREAFNSATEVDAPKYSPASYHKAEESYYRALALYKEGAFSEAIVEFRSARAYAERAETAARVQRQKSGDEGL
jgi:hypothetical protein